MPENNPVNNHMMTGYSDMSVRLKAKDSSIEGKGLFTDVSLKKGDVVFKIIGQKMHHAYTPELARENPNWIGTGYGEWLVMSPGDTAMFLNHCCEPNVIINSEQEIIAIRPIEADEELLLDYSTTELDPYWKMECSCGARTCRKELRSFQFLPDELKEKYGPFLDASFTSTAQVLSMHQQAS